MKAVARQCGWGHVAKFAMKSGGDNDDDSNVDDDDDDADAGKNVADNHCGHDDNDQ